MASRYLTGAAVALAFCAWSCDGSHSPASPTAPVDVAGGDEAGAATASAAGKITICHKGQELRVSVNALGGHIGHGDRVGSCAATCPCFSSAGIEQMAGQCPVGLLVGCYPAYSISMFCVSGGSVGNMGSFEAYLGSNTCSTTLQDAYGNFSTSTQNVTPEEYEACRQALVGSTPYPAYCPR
jgi:hypothetical protein